MKENIEPRAPLSAGDGLVKVISIEQRLPAMQFKGYNLPEIKEFCPKAYQSDKDVHAIFIPSPIVDFKINIGDWIIKYPCEMYYPCKEENFEKKYAFAAQFREGGEAAGLKEATKLSDHYLQTCLNAALAADPIKADYVIKDLRKRITKLVRQVQKLQGREQGGKEV